MKTQYAKRKLHQCNTYGAGDTVTVWVPKNERSSTDMPRLLCYVNEDTHDLYQLHALATPHDNPKVEQKREPAQTVITSWYNFVATACYSS
eukprot:Em0017g118a